MPGWGREIGGGVLDLLFPPCCLLCGALAEPFCDACRREIVPVPRGENLPAGVDDVASAGVHDGPLRRAVLRLKFERKVVLAEPMGELLAGCLEPLLPEWQPELLAPVPIHWTRRWERGFNQSELLAEAVSRRAGVPVRRMLRRVRRTPPQVGRGRAERAANVRGAFAVRDGARSGGAVVLIDDVRTSGSTLGECAAVLREAGHAPVYALTVTFETG